MDRFEAMTILVAAVDGGSLSAASRRLGKPMATVSRKVSELERMLGTRLLVRSSRRIGLTDAGRSYYAASKRILEEVDEAERAASGEYSEPRGDLVVTAPVVFGRLHVVPVVTAFLEAYPEIAVRLVLADRVVDLFEDRVDLAVRIGRLPDSSLVARRVGAIRLAVCASPAYFAARGMPRAPADLRAHDCIAFESLTAPDAWSFGTGRASVMAPVRCRLVVNTAEAAIDAALAGAGITRVLSYQIAHDLEADRLALALQSFEPEPWPVSLVHRGGALLPIKLRAFLDFAAPRLRASLARVEAATRG
jgi:DNA-binding transcriptional LysR family regulator